MSGSCTRARPSRQRLCCPVDIDLSGVARSASIPRVAMISPARDTCSSVMRRASVPCTPMLEWNPDTTTSSAVVVGVYRCCKSCDTTPMCLRNSHTFQSSRPRIFTDEPSATTGYSSRLIVCNSVVLPEPFGPRTATRSCCSIVRSKFSKTRVLPRQIVALRISISGGSDVTGEYY